MIGFSTFFLMNNGFYDDEYVCSIGLVAAKIEKFGEYTKKNGKKVKPRGQKSEY